MLTLSQPRLFVMNISYIKVSVKFIKQDCISFIMIIHHKITIIRQTRPKQPNINRELQWFGKSLGLFKSRDKDRSCYRIFVELLKSSKKGDGLTSDEIAERAELSRGTVVHHLNHLMDSGIVIRSHKKYHLRNDSLEMLIEELEKDVLRTLNNLKTIGQRIDKRLDH